MIGKLAHNHILSVQRKSWDLRPGLSDSKSQSFSPPNTHTTLPLPTCTGGFPCKRICLCVCVRLSALWSNTWREQVQEAGLSDACVAGSLFLLWDKGLVGWNSSPHNSQEGERQWGPRTRHHLQECTPINYIFKLSPISESFHHT